MSNNDFTFDTSYNPDSAFSRVKFGVNRPILETELNEMQKISEDRLTNFVRQNAPTGFLEIVKRDFIGEPIIYNPNNLENCIAIAPCTMSLNGYNVVIEGKDVVNSVKGYTIVKLGEAPQSSSSYFDFVYLELWFEEVGAQSAVYKNGNINGEILNNNILDNRVAEETSRRVGIRYKINVKNNVDLNKWPEGFGFNNMSDYSDIYASGPRNAPIINHDYLFISASGSEFKNTSFYSDKGLYVAGRPDGRNLNADFGVLEKYIFAVPLIGIKRRNKSGYSSNNPNGANQYVSLNTISDRPDGLFYNRIDQRDVVDLRKTISFGQFNAVKMLDENLKKLMNGSLITNKRERLLRTQFGITPIEDMNDNFYNRNAIFHVKFRNQTLLPSIGLAGVPSGNPEYHLAASGYGLSLNGKFSIQYPIDSFTKNEGTIDFFLKPYWNGTDQNVSQTILAINDETQYPIMLLTKTQGQLVMRLNYNKEASQSSYTIAYLDKNTIYDNEICHIRFTWLSSINGNESKIYINGNLAAANAYSPSALSPKYLVLGKNGETISSQSPDHVGCVVDEFVIYNKVLDNNFIQLSGDIMSGDAKIHPSFNGILSSFKNNVSRQLTVTPITTTVDDNSFTLTVPYGFVVDSNSPLSVYNPTNGNIYTGVWSSFDNNTAVFTLSNSLKFAGETVWVVHSIIVPGGFGIKDIPTKILKAVINNEEMSFASTIEERRPVLLINPDNSVEKIHKAYDYNSSRDSKSAFARIIEYTFDSNGTNIYTLPATLYGREVIGIKHINKPLTGIMKNSDGSFEITLVNELQYNEKVVVTAALGGFTFEYETYTKSPIVNIMKASTIKVPTVGNSRNYTISAANAIPGSNILNPSGGVVVSFLGLEGYNENYDEVDFGTSVFITGDQFNYFAKATVSGVGTPIININFETTPQAGHFIEIPVLVTYQPRKTDIISVWYDYLPYQGTLRQNSQKSLKRLTNWKLFCTTLGSGKLVVNNAADKSINNASNRLPGGQTYSYLLDGSDIEFVGEQMTIPPGYNDNYKSNSKLIFRNQFTELVFNNEYDQLVDSLDAEFNIAKLFGQSHQDAFISSEISDMNFFIQDTKDAMHKYVGATCLVVDEQGSILMLVVGEIKTIKTQASIMKPTHGDLFKLSNNPIVIPSRY